MYNVELKMILYRLPRSQTFEVLLQNIPEVGSQGLIRPSQVWPSPEAQTIQQGQSALEIL